MQKGELKEYYTRISTIIREYIEFQFEFNALELPTRDIVSHLNNLPDNEVKMLEDILKKADNIKYAKGLSLDEKNKLIIQQSVEFIKKTKIEKIYLLNNISFQNTELFFLLLIPISHLIWFFFVNNNTNRVISFSNTSFISSKKNIKEKLVNLPYILQQLCISFIIISLAFSLKQQIVGEEIKTEGIDIILALDISESMYKRSKT